MFTTHNSSLFPFRKSKNPQKWRILILKGRLHRLFEISIKREGMPSLNNVIV